ncbi:MAG TPA: DPP IV N-terminal domain-containing protein [Thermoanaerobaculia bacterium]|nr:DPP IV N-terminal domain-containing protein [Thermoanaerobaculia bacterium]
MTKHLTLFLLLLAAPLFAQKKALTLEAIYHPTDKLPFAGAIQDDFEWVDDRTFVWPRKDEQANFVEWRVYDVTTGKERALFDRAKFVAALTELGVDDETARDASESDELAFDRKKSAFLVNVADDLYLYSIAKNAVTRLTSAPGEEEEATFSPDGTKVAFVRANDLYVVDLAGRERRLTTDGSAVLLNGKLDYVYQEEIYGRGIWKAFWWSPDSLRLAFLQLDERQVPESTIPDHIPYRPDLHTFRYPKAGDPNPRAKLFIIPASGGERIEASVERYSGGEFLIVNVDWRADGKALTYQVQNREQTWLDLVSASPASGESHTLIRETTKTWVDPLANPAWLKDGSFLWQSERNGYRHLYHYSSGGTLLRQVTNGEWEAREVHGISGQQVYFSGTERSPIGLDVYRINLDGTGLQRLSEAGGKHTAFFNPSRTHYVDKWSDIRTPDQIRLHRNDGTVARVIDENRVALLAEYELPRIEFMQVKTRDGFPMEAMMIRPTNFDPSKKYPVYQFLYGGPHAQYVRNEWRGQMMLFNRLIAQQGAIVWMCDNRSASGKGAVSAWPVYKNLGELELRDEEDSIAWLEQQAYVDGERILINGWSYGGFLVLYAMTHSTTFKAGIAGAPVTDWRDYDSIYTERMMQMPQNNAEGYRKSSPRFHAKDLHGNLMLIHGSTDDNVHFQNSVQFAWELQQLGTPFEMMVLPRTRHTVTQKNTLYFLQKTVLRFVTRELLLGNSFATSQDMSKENPNQDYYKTGGRSQSDGPDREHANVNDDKQQLAQSSQDVKNSKHPAVLRSKKK